MGTKATTESLDRHIGSRLRALRLQRNLSLEAVAEIIDVSQQQLSRYELGHNRLSAAQLFRLAEGLHVPLGWFFRGYEEEVARQTGAVQEAMPVWQSGRTEESEQALVLAWRALETDLEREKVIDLLEALTMRRRRA